MDGTDAELAARAAGGGREAFAELVRRHHPRVLRLCLSLLRDEAEAEDAAQGVFLKAWERLGSFEGSAAFTTWLHRIATNHCLDALRRLKRTRTVSWDAMAEARGDAWEKLAAEPDRAAEAAERRDLLEALLSDLPPDYRLALTLRELEGLSYEELARATGWTVESVRARLRRAREKVAERLRHLRGAQDV